MITFAYTPIGSSAVTSVTLLDSDRFWPASMDIAAHGEVQVSVPMRALTKTFFGRGLKHFELTFPATRQHVNLFASATYCWSTLPAICGALGTLTIALPAGGTLRAVNCVCQGANARQASVRSYANFTFVGPSIGP